MRSNGPATYCEIRDPDFDRVRNTIVGITVLSFAAREKNDVAEGIRRIYFNLGRRPAGDLIRDALRFVSKVEWSSAVRTWDPALDYTLSR